MYQLNWVQNETKSLTTHIFFIIPASTDFYSNFFKNKKIDDKEYQEWNHIWREKLLFPLKKIQL